jgi:hypothetical protein
VTGYDPSVVPPDLVDTPVIVKPINEQQILDCLVSLTASGAGPSPA